MSVCTAFINIQYKLIYTLKKNILQLYFEHTNVTHIHTYNIIYETYLHM